MQAYLWLIAILAAGECMSIYLHRRHERVMARLQRVSDAYDAWEQADRLLDEWQAARPFLFIGQCEYAQLLVREMIQASKEIAEYNGYPAEEMEYIELLYRMLDEKPPPEDEPSKPREAGLCIAIPWYFAILFARLRRFSF